MEHRLPENKLKHVDLFVRIYLVVASKLTEKSKYFIEFFQSEMKNYQKSTTVLRKSMDEPNKESLFFGEKRSDIYTL